MKKTTLAATTAVVLTASVAVLYGALPALAQAGADPMGKAPVTWAEAKTRADAMWTKFDVNKDGVINEADRAAKMTQMFDTIDANHDGAVSRAEFTDHHKAMMEGKGHNSGMDGAEGRGPGKGMGMGHGGRMLHKMAEMADTNHDKSVSRAEFDAAAKARFDKADADHDGKLTSAERRAAWGAMRKEHGGRGGHGRGHGMHDGMGGDMPPPPPPLTPGA